MNKEELIALIREAHAVVEEAIPGLGSSFEKEMLVMWALALLKSDRPERIKELCPHVSNLHYEMKGLLVGKCSIKNCRCGIEVLAIGAFSECTTYEVARIQEAQKFDSLWGNTNGAADGKMP